MNDLPYSALMNVLDARRFGTEYQPIVPVGSGGVRAYEAPVPEPVSVATAA